MGSDGERVGSSLRCPVCGRLETHCVSCHRAQALAEVLHVHDQILENPSEELIKMVEADVRAKWGN